MPPFIITNSSLHTVFFMCVSCCVDEIAAEHGSADCIIHFGHSCLSPTKRLPVMYLFGEITVDVDQGCDKIIQCLSEENITNVALVYDVSVHHCIGKD